MTTATRRAKAGLVVILGPTAAGKSELAVRLAERFDGEIVNADSMQVYRGLDIGTAKPSQELRERAPHHLLDQVPPDVNFTAADFVAAASAAICEIQGRGKRVFVVGGTGLYIRALLKGLAVSPGGDEEIRRQLVAVAAAEGNDGLMRRLAAVDPETAARLHPNDRLRIIRALEVYQQTGLPLSRYQADHGFAEKHYDCLQLGLLVEREELYRRIEVRVDAMLAAGLVAEVAALLAQGFSPESKPFKAIGYKQVCAYLAGSCSLAEAVELIKRDTRRYAKRQLTWFKSEPEIYWVEYPESFASICNHVIDFFAQRSGV
ncbi:MAG TPA: tRNA (adenosine(37)-N6)-dimethylallyltransferase MiaA [Geobacteraceae bacterium]